MPVNIKCIELKSCINSLRTYYAEFLEYTHTVYTYLHACILITREKNVIIIILLLSWMLFKCGLVFVFFLLHQQTIHGQFVLLRLLIAVQRYTFSKMYLFAVSLLAGVLFSVALGKDNGILTIIVIYYSTNIIILTVFCSLYHTCIHY